MSDTIYYIYDKSTGEFGGSGITLFDDEQWGSTTVSPPVEPTPPVLKWDGAQWLWVPAE